jgi:hypothetical protein
MNSLQIIIVICISRMRNRTLTNREENCRQGRFAAEARQSRDRQITFLCKNLQLLPIRWTRI